MLAFYLSLITTDSERDFVIRVYYMLNRRLLSYAYKLSSDTQWAQDAAQQAILVVINKIQKFMKMSDDEISAYCFTIVRNYFYRCYKRRSREVDFELSDFDKSNSEGSDPVQDSVLQQLEYEEVKDAIQSLPERQQMILALKYGAKLTHSEIAAQMGISESYSQNLLSAAIKGLRKALESNADGKKRAI